MGLDSVELLITVEKKFGIEIPDNEAEEINTVRDFVNVVYKRISLEPNQKCLTQIIFYRLRKAFTQFGILKSEINPNSIISDLLPCINLKEEWRNVEESLGLRLPGLVKLDLNKELKKDVRILGIKIYGRTEPITNCTIKELIDWIISINYKKLISFENITSKYEVERIICGIISELMSIPINEIELEDSITKDLRIN